MVVRTPAQAAPRHIPVAQSSPYLTPPPRTAQQLAAAPGHRGEVLRPPGGVGTSSEPRPQQTASNTNAVGNFFSNLFGQR
jgi:hypothetical protein